jgi:hypothetical protein
MRRVLEPSMPDHMHWYRVIGAVYERWRICDSPQVAPVPAVQSSGEACALSPDSDRAVYERWLNSGA